MKNLIAGILFGTLLTASASVITLAQGQKASSANTDDCNGAKLHKTTPHNPLQKVGEAVIPTLQKIHESALQRDCQLDKVTPAPKPSTSPSPRKN